MDHIRKALEKSQSDARSVRDWMQPVGNQPAAPVAPSAPPPATGPVEAPPERNLILDKQLLIENNVVTAANESNAVVDRYRLLRTRVRQAMKPNGWSVLGLTSPTPKAGKTLTTLNLAITMAQAENHQVVVVDADLRLPSIAPTLGINVKQGLVDYLRGDVALPDIYQCPTDFPNLTLIPGRATNDLEHPSELLNSKRFDSMIRGLRSAGETTTVIVDTPPVYLGDDVLAIAPKLDCMILVFEEGVTTSEEIQETARMLTNYNLIGSVLNKSSEKPRKFESYYQSAGGR